MEYVITIIVILLLIKIIISSAIEYRKLDTKSLKDKIEILELEIEYLSNKD